MSRPVAPPRLRLARLPTPFQLLEELSQQLGSHRIWVKRDDFTGLVTTGNKIRKLEFLAGEAMQQGCKSLVSCGGVQSNHCRATAAVASRLNLKAELVLRADGGDTGNEPDGNLLLSQLYGARTHILPADRYRRECEELMSSLAAESNGYRIPTGGSNPTGMWGYISAAEELRNDFQEAGIRPDHIVLATGSGGTQAGLIVGCNLEGLDCSIWGISVCEDAAWFEHQIRGDLHGWSRRFGGPAEITELPVRVIEGYAGPAYGVANPEVYRSIQRAARCCDLILDPVYTGKAFHGMLQEIEAGRFGAGGDIVFIHTGGLFGLFPRRRELISAMRAETAN